MAPDRLYSDIKGLGRGYAHELERDRDLGFNSRTVRVRVYTGKMRKTTDLTVIYALVNGNGE
jgi:hypothetical protein